MGRLRVIDQLAGQYGGISLSVGSKSTRLADVNIDIVRRVFPDIVATVFQLPLRSDIFDVVLFNDVIQYLPAGTEAEALLELRRCSKKNGRIILSAPNAVTLFTLLDPDRWMFGNRPYSMDRLLKLVRTTGLRVELSTVSGGIWEAISLLAYYFTGYLLGRILRRELPFPLRLARKSDAEYNHPSERGYTIFLVCSKSNGGKT